MVAFIDAERETYGVEPMGAVLPIAPATYFRGIVNLLRAARSCPVKSTPPIVLNRHTSPHPIQRTRECGAGGGEPTAGGVD